MSSQNHRWSNLNCLYLSQHHAVFMLRLGLGTNPLLSLGNFMDWSRSHSLTSCEINLFWSQKKRVEPVANRFLTSEKAENIQRCDGAVRSLNNLYIEPLCQCSVHAEGSAHLTYALRLRWAGFYSFYSFWSGHFSFRDLTCPQWHLAFLR